MNTERTTCIALQTFPACLDGITSQMIVAGQRVDVPSGMVPGWVEAGLVARDEAPTGETRSVAPEGGEAGQGNQAPPEGETTSEGGPDEEKAKPAPENKARKPAGTKA